MIEKLLEIRGATYQVCDKVHCVAEYAFIELKPKTWMSARPLRSKFLNISNSLNALNNDVCGCIENRNGRCNGLNFKWIFAISLLSTRGKRFDPSFEQT